ncbi:FAD/NAD(P)-binding protein [Corynebacterium sp. A21]|uniref:FAD/NAD(P)-binding protein n=1 Tax=Corynebacterium sp. A21 TaxID=3457318 RepID=UPI003FD1A7DF
MATGATHLLIVGGGPRAIGVLDRLIANNGTPDLPAATSLEIHLVDPYSPGSGRIWRYKQHGLLWMNSRAADVTIFTDDSFTAEGPVRPGPSLSEWAEQVRRGEITLDSTAEEIRPEIEALTPDTFASRKVQSCYMRWVFQDLVDCLPENFTLHTHQNTVTSLRENLAADSTAKHYTATLDSGELIQADLVALTLGHTDSHPTPRDTAKEDFAARHGLYYARPAQTQDVDYSPLGWDRNVLVSGMGLAFVDLLALLFEGRGGTFHPDPRPHDPERLRYQPSGREPRLWVGSRRGVPYHSKISATLKGEFSPGLEFISEEFFAQLPTPFNFRRDVLPMIIAESEYFVYREILSGHPEWAGMSWAEFRPRFIAAVKAGEDRHELIATAVPDPALRVDLPWLNHPFADREFSSREEVQQALRDYISEDLRLRTSAEHSETLALFYGLLFIQDTLARILPLERLDDDSRLAFPGGWTSFFSLVDSGPPPLRLRQLLAVHRQGLIMFLGPSSRISLDEESGRFIATSDQSPDRVSTDAYLDAYLPPQVVAGSANPLLADLAAPGGLGREQRFQSPEGEYSTGRLEVDQQFRLLAQNGHPHRRIWAAGPNTSEVQVGAFARPGTDAAAFRRNDGIARQILQAAAEFNEG